MTKSEFLAALRQGLSALPEGDIEKSIEYYGEMIDDRMEEGLDEQEAVEAVGSVEELLEGVLGEQRAGEEKTAPEKRANPWVIVLLALGSPVWLALLAAAAAVVLSVYAVIWTVVITLYAAMLGLASGALGGLFFAVTDLTEGLVMQSLTLAGAGLVCAGLAILVFQLSNIAARGAIGAGRGIVHGIKKSFGRRENGI